MMAYIAGFTAPPGKTMGHAGAIISGSAGTAQAKKEALEAHGSTRRRPDRSGATGSQSVSALELDRRTTSTVSLRVHLKKYGRGCRPLPPDPTNAGGSAE